MADMISDDQLREMAAHRLLKLVKSKRRKPGVGDYGKFGLMDADGNELLGFGNDGLTASAEDVENYLRANAVGTWKQSADTVPARTAPKKPVLVRDDGSRQAQPAKPKVKKPTASPAAKTVLSPSPKPTSKHKPDAKKPSQEPKPKPEPILRVRAAKPQDAEAIATLLSQLNGLSVEAKDAHASLDHVQKAKGGTIVAELDEVIGCCSWVLIPTLHRGQIGRITVMIVDEAHRRKGIGSAMLVETADALKNAGCPQIEVVSDIAVSNSHNFFRSMGYAQASYRFVSKIDTTS